MRFDRDRATTRSSEPEAPCTTRSRRCSSATPTGTSRIRRRSLGRMARGEPRRRRARASQHAAAAPPQARTRSTPHRHRNQSGTEDLPRPRHSADGLSGAAALVAERDRSATPVGRPASACGLRKCSAQATGMKDHVAGREAPVELLALPSKELPLGRKHRFTDLGRRQPRDHGACSGNRAACSMTPTGEKPGSLPHAAHARYPIGCRRSSHAMTSIQSRTSSRPISASTLFVARSSRSCRSESKDRATASLVSWNRSRSRDRRRRPARAVSRSV